MRTQKICLYLPAVEYDVASATHFHGEKEREERKEEQ